MPWTAEALELSRQLAELLNNGETATGPSSGAQSPEGTDDMAIIQAKAGGGAKVKPGAYIVTCMGADADKLEDAKFGTGEVIRFLLELDDELDEQGNPIELDAIANAKLTPKSKLWSWCDAFGVPPVVGQAYDTDAVIGQKAQAIIVDKANDDGSVFSRVENIVPLPRSMGGKGKPSPTVINEDGSPNYTAFWAALRALGLNRGHVIAHVGDIETFMAMEGADVANVLEELKAQLG